MHSAWDHAPGSIPKKTNVSCWLSKRPEQKPRMSHSADGWGEKVWRIQSIMSPTSDSDRKIHLHFAAFYLLSHLSSRLLFRCHYGFGYRWKLDNVWWPVTTLIEPFNAHPTVLYAHCFVYFKVVSDFSVVSLLFMFIYFFFGEYRLTFRLIENTFFFINVERAHKRARLITSHQQIFHSHVSIERKTSAKKIIIHHTRISELETGIADAN